MTTVVSKLTLAVVSVVASVGAFAATPTVATSSVSVRYDDLNLSTTEGVNSLYHRISSAARQVCPGVYSRDLYIVAAAQRCEANAVSKAVSEVNNPHLAMVHASRVSQG
jgi:UrcA family protein